MLCIHVLTCILKSILILKSIVKLSLTNKDRIHYYSNTKAVP